MICLSRIADNYAFMIEEAKKGSENTSNTTENDICGLSKRVLNTLEEFRSNSHYKPNEENNKQSLFGHSKQR